MSAFIQMMMQHGPFKGMMQGSSGGEGSSGGGSKKDKGRPRVAGIGDSARVAFGDEEEEGRKTMLGR